MTMGRLSDRQGEKENPREPVEPSMPTSRYRQLPVRREPWQDEADRRLQETFARLGVQSVPEPPARERSPLLAFGLIGLGAVVIAAGVAYAGMTLMFRPSALATSEAHVDVAAADVPPAPPAQGAAPPVAPPPAAAAPAF